MAQAALKLIRTENQRCIPTDKSFSECLQNLEEELADVYLCCTLLGISVTPEIVEMKHKRLVNKVKLNVNADGERDC